MQDLKAANEISEAGGFHHAFAWSGLELAKAYRAAGDLNSAEHYAAQALGVMRDVEDKYHLPQHIAILAELEARAAHFRQADQLYDQATDLINALLVNAPRQIESSLIATLSNVYLGHFALAVMQLHDTAKAFDIIEEARGRSLADALRNRNVSTPSVDPSTAAAQEDVNRTQLALLHETDRDKRKGLFDELFEAEQKATSLDSRPQTPIQTAADHLKPIALADFRLTLHPNEIVLEYVLDEPRSLCVRITRSQATVIVLPQGRRGIESAIDDYLAEIRAGSPATAAGQRLYSILLQPVVAHTDKPNLVVVPDGKLNFLPFDALTDAAGRLVLETHVVTYTPSSTVLYLIRKTPIARKPARRFLGIGAVQAADQADPQPGRMPSSAAAATNPFRDDPVQLSLITKTRDEIADADRALGGRGKLLLGKDATEAAFKSQSLGDFQIIHFAAHGIANAQFPDRAALVLASDPQAREDGLLQVREIRDLDLHADLVTLSGCETALGDVEGEEGVANLARAFLFAGARSVVASVWPASDIYTQNLMNRFYRQLAEGLERGEALRQAKLDLIQEFGDQAVPDLWAGFLLVGDGTGSQRN